MVTRTKDKFQRRGPEADDVITKYFDRPKLRHKNCLRIRTKPG